MKVRQGLALVLALGLGSAAYLHAADTPGDAPQEKKPAKAPKNIRLTQPWSKMSTLTLEQKQQIAAIHKQALADKKKIDEKEKEDILALLSPEQKAEAEKVQEDGTAAKKKTADTPATQPDGGM